jgi:hypothetical protein
MCAAGFRGVSRRNWIITTVRDRDARLAPDLIERNFTAVPNRPRHDGLNGGAK